MAADAHATERDRLQSLHLALDASLEQLAQALEAATRGTPLGAEPGDDARTIERLLAELTGLRNHVRDRLMKAMARRASSLDIVK
jgi:hypothetical protein